jgi:hypothetical protein
MRTSLKMNKKKQKNATIIKSPPMNERVCKNSSYKNNFQQQESKQKEHPK